MPTDPVALGAGTLALLVVASAITYYIMGDE